MARVKPLTATERMNREFQAALKAGQARMGEKDRQTAEWMPTCAESTYYRRAKKPEKFTLADIRVLAQRYGFTDYQLCQFIGVEYRGNTPA
jgi:hypothetical protein